jgi:hypothetical protein
MHGNGSAYRELSISVYMISPHPLPFYARKAKVGGKVLDEQRADTTQGQESSHANKA